MTSPGPPVLLWALDAAAPGNTGIGRYVMDLTFELLVGERRLGYELCGPHEAGEPDWLPGGASVRRVRGHRQLVHAAWIATGWPPVERLAGPASLVHSLSPAMPVPSRSPSVMTVHDLFPITNPDWYPRRMRVSIGKALERAARDAAALIAVSSATAAALDEVFPECRGRVTVIPSGISDRYRATFSAAEVDAARERIGIPPGPYIISVGRLMHRKNMPTLLSALARTSSDVRLVVVGPDGNGAETYEAAVAREGVRDRITRPGWIQESDLVPLIAGARALVHPSLAEGFGFTPLEAMAAGTPALVADGSSPPDILGPAAVPLPAHDADEWASAIDRAVNDDDWRVDRSIRGRAWAEQFTWASTADRTAAVHEAVLDARQ